MTLHISIAKAFKFLWCILTEFFLLSSCPNDDDLSFYVILKALHKYSLLYF